MWYLTRDVLKNKSGRDLYEKERKYLSILDPACGSGTFLSEAILHINESFSNKKINKDGKIFALMRDRDQDKKIEESLFGFELNPLSKSIADINIFFGLIQTYGGYSKEELINFINIYRTDSLKNFKNTDLDSPDFEEEFYFYNTKSKTLINKKVY